MEKLFTFYQCREFSSKRYLRLQRATKAWVGRRVIIFKPVPQPLDISTLNTSKVWTTLQACPSPVGIVVCSSVPFGDFFLITVTRLVKIRLESHCQAIRPGYVFLHRDCCLRNALTTGAQRYPPDQSRKYFIRFNDFLNLYEWYVEFVESPGN